MSYWVWDDSNYFLQFFKTFFKENVGVQMPDICKSQEKYCWLTKTAVLKNNLQAQYLKNAEIIWNKSKQRDIKNWKDLS